jgi:uncharacterized protein (DUF1800 family)
MSLMPEISLSKVSAIVALTAATLLAGCGGGGGGTTPSSTVGDGNASSTSQSASLPNSDAEAYRFLVQSTFGPTSSDVAQVRAVGYAPWIEQQFALQLQTSHVATVNGASSAPGPNELNQSWWTHAIKDPAQLRQRVAFALSEIFVISTMNDAVTNNGPMAASYLDMLTAKADGNYRDLLEAVTLHPAMGNYLSYLGNFKEDPTTGRIPDENYAREVMQLFSIGLYELNDDGSLKLVNGLPKETYTSDDVKGLAKVFTGMGWSRPAGNTSAVWWQCLWRTAQCSDPSQLISAMGLYPEVHSVSEKRFLGVVVPAQSTPDPRASLKAALDRLASHPNTAPFISKQLIQRLVTSNPSPTYVADVTAAFRASNGNLKATVKAILLHPEARTQVLLTGGEAAGKLREPVLRLTHLLRALPHTSDTFAARQFYKASTTDDASSELGQTPMRSPSVFNFFRPGYKPPQTRLASLGLVAPEMQITTENSVLGYANFMARILSSGWGQYNNTTQLYDIRFDLSSLDALPPATLVSTLSDKLLGGPAPAALKTLMVNSLTQMSTATVQDRHKRVQAGRVTQFHHSTVRVSP